MWLLMFMMMKQLLYYHPKLQQLLMQRPLQYQLLLLCLNLLVRLLHRLLLRPIKGLLASKEPKKGMDNLRMLAAMLYVLGKAVPLLGAGAKGAPAPEAMRIAASAAVTWRATNGKDPPRLRLRFGLTSSTAAHELVEALEAAIALQPIFEASPPPGDERWALS